MKTKIYNCPAQQFPADIQQKLSWVRIINIFVEVTS